ncbi:unnamed protein product [Symbiodinium natans]|uniref:Uncharacterized protein n=1 Tax=Symbiodinium natans TaxID=878477 RepID=A0A812U890_9DINO|nr:unnamed protein product [Symbiodinium natans]
MVEVAGLLSSGDSDADHGEEQAFSPDWPTVAAEIATMTLAILGLLLLLAGLGFWTVHPPGEPELCQIDTLGLQNLTLARQRSDLAACHGLYKVVFTALGVISWPFILCGFFALLIAWMLSRRATPNKCRRVTCIAVLEVIGTVIVWFPSLLFPSLSLAVAAGMAPIHAYFISITAGHIVISVSGADSGNSTANKAAHMYQVLYEGYCAASRVELCLSIGGVALLLLFWCFVADILRIIASLTCWRSKLEDPRGFQLWQMLQHWRRR